ncbi:uncharacterized protein LOC111636630 [Centruroides sculpturatus]|uniref:uncharacterized protein LOC111636630 n=1 Tax=Centruroides sculpturatus TaxID=218467 RepID=UPI000C6E3765|nr:uncharacterized protein LOC111636630 [Centruroides sculpturatus]
MGNERADALAKEATLQSEIAYNKIPLSYIKKMLRQESIQEWQEEWSYSEKGRHTFWLLPNIQERIHDLNWLPIDHIMTQLLTNHCNTKEYLNRIGKHQDISCECGNGNHSLEHVINDCSKYDMDRMQLRLLITECLNTTELDLYRIIRTKTLAQDMKTFTRKVLS